MVYFKRKLKRRTGVAVSDANPEQKDWTDFAIHLGIPQWIIDNLCYPGTRRRPDKIPLEYYKSLNIPSGHKGVWGLEIQQEALYYIEYFLNSNSWLSKDILDNKAYPGLGPFLYGCLSEGFVGFHTPTKGRDISSLDEGHRIWSIDEYKASMHLANYLGVYYWLLHCSNFGRGDEIDREARMRAFYASIRELSHYYFQNNFDFYWAVENIEYPKFPAGGHEFQDMFSRVRTIFNDVKKEYANKHMFDPGYKGNGENVYMAFDIPHFVHNMLMENSFKCSIDETLDCMEKFIDYNADNILVQHNSHMELAGNGSNVHLKTHLPFKPIRREYGKHEANQERILNMGDIKNPDKPHVLEVFNVSLDVVRESHNIVADYLGQS